MVRSFKELDVWNGAIEMGKRVYEITKRFPGDERYGLVSQLRRAVVSISSNIAEGCGRRTDKDFVQFLYVAMGSIREVESQLFIARELDYLDEESLVDMERELDKLGKMLMGFINYISKGGNK